MRIRIVASRTSAGTPKSSASRQLRGLRHHRATGHPYREWMNLIPEPKRPVSAAL